MSHVNLTLLKPVDTKGDFGHFWASKQYANDYVRLHDFLLVMHSEPRSR